jgi:putative endopeptidase
MRLTRNAPAAALIAAILLSIGSFLPTGAVLAAGAPAQHHGLTLADMDTTVAPCQDFFQYANGGWVARTKMPPAYSRYGGFSELQDRNLENVHKLLEDAVRQVKAKPGGNVGLLATYYGTCMDSATAEKQGDQPLRPTLARIAALTSTAGLGAEAARLHSEGVGVLFFLAGIPDPGNSDMVITTANQGGLGLPNRDYYFKSDSNSVHIRDAYVAHVARTFQLLGSDAAKAGAQAKTVMSIETSLAAISLSPVQLRDPRGLYHKMPLADLKKLCPSLDWDAYLSESHVTKVAEVNVRQPKFFTGLDSLLKAVPLADWQTYLGWHVARSGASLLSSAWVNEDFRFEQVLSGAKEMMPRWRRCLESTDRALGDPLGQEYVKQYFPPETKARALAMVHNLEAALHDRIQSLTWMSDSTKAQALGKLEAFGLKIGYPDKWRDYSALKLDGGSYAANASRVSRFERAYRLGKIGGPVDKAEFNMTPPTVNARYSPNLNDVLFPAGILQPPFYDPEADDAVNYGGIGAVIGHEMTHGFDDQGRQFDAKGNLRDWWTADDASKYKAQVDRIIAQYDGYTVADSVHVNGRLTTGENIADLGGLTVSYAALQKALAGKPRTKIDGFTPEQRFFLGYGRIWRQIIRDEEARRRVATDPHSPARWRVNGPLSDMPEFKKAFGCATGDPMVRDESVRVTIW